MFDKNESDKLLFDIHGKVCGIESKIEHLATKANVEDAICEQYKHCEMNRWTPKKIAAVGGIITAIGGAIAAILVVL